MTKDLYEIDFFRMFGLPKPTCGMIRRIISDKGIRKSVQDWGYSYSFKTDDQLYRDEPNRVVSGIYQVLDVCKLQDEVCWCNYLFIIDHDGSVYPVAEYLKQPDTKWVRDALPVVKEYFSGKELEPIEITDLRPKKRKSSWKSAY